MKAWKPHICIFLSLLFLAVAFDQIETNGWPWYWLGASAWLAGIRRMEF